MSHSLCHFQANALEGHLYVVTCLALENVLIRCCFCFRAWLQIVVFVAAVAAAAAAASAAAKIKHWNFTYTLTFQLATGILL